MANDQQSEGSKQHKESAVAGSASERLNESCDALVEYGGFELIEASIDGVKAMNPVSKARKNIF